MPRNKLVLFTTIAILGFAGNSILNRYALAGSTSSPMIYSLIRVISGAIFLLILCGGKIKELLAEKNLNYSKYIKASLALSIYLWGFSMAYGFLSAGMGALILFTTVQLALFSIGLSKGVRPGIWSFTGLGISLLGLVILLYPTLSSENNPIHFSYMIVAGIAWAFYTYLGKGSTDPITENAIQFTLSGLLIGIYVLIFNTDSLEDFTYNQITASLLSGVICSGLAYSVWYKVLPNLTLSASALLQLFVPIITYIFGVILLGEALSLHIITSALIMTFGIALGIIGQKK
jgi:drug/metabolite transporter (DMT)-like permease